MPPAKFQVVFLNGDGHCCFPAQFPLVSPAYFLRPPPHDGFQPPSQASQHFSMESIQLDFQVDDSRQAANPHTRDGPPVRGYAYRLSLDLWMVILSIQDFTVFPSHSSWHDLESQTVDQWCQFLVSSFEADRARALEHEANSANGNGSPNHEVPAPPSPWRKITVLDPLPDLAIRFSTMYAYSAGQAKNNSADSTAANSPTKPNNHGDDASGATDAKSVSSPVHLQPQLAGPIQAPLRDMRAASSVTDPVRAFGFVPSVHWDDNVPMMASPLHPRYDAVVAFAGCFLLVEWAPLDHLRRASLARQSMPMKKSVSPKKEQADGHQMGGSYLDRSSSSGADHGDGADPSSPTRFGHMGAPNAAYDMWGNATAGWYPQAQPGYGVTPGRGGYYSPYAAHQPAPGGAGRFGGGNGADMYMDPSMYHAAAMAAATNVQPEAPTAAPQQSQSKSSGRGGRRVPKGDRRCTVCLTTESRLWRRGGENNQDYLCNACGLREGRQKRKFALLDALIQQDKAPKLAASTQHAPSQHPATAAPNSSTDCPSLDDHDTHPGPSAHAPNNASTPGGSGSHSQLKAGSPFEDLSSADFGGSGSKSTPGNNVLMGSGAAAGVAQHPPYPNERMAAAESSGHQSPFDHQRQ